LLGFFFNYTKSQVTGGAEETTELSSSVIVVSVDVSIGSEWSNTNGAFSILRFDSLFSLFGSGSLYGESTATSGKLCSISVVVVPFSRSGFMMFGVLEVFPSFDCSKNFRVLGSVDSHLLVVLFTRGDD
jgi:hypothetical protein